MADLELHQALTTVDQKKIQHMDLDNTVRWVAKYALETENDTLSFMFKVGMPGKFPTGEWGFVVWGDSGMHVIPDPDPLDHRTSFRYGELDRYPVKLGSLYGVMAPMTIYSRPLRLGLMRPEEIKAIHLQAVAKALPNYFKYISFMIFGGATGKAKNRPVLRDYIAKYIEPSDGAQNGYKFYLSDGYGEINLQKVIKPTKVKEHALKKRLDEINKIIYKDANKVEAKLADYVDKKQWIKTNLVEESQKTLAVYYKVQESLRQIIADGHFDKKYKVDSEKFKGFNIPVSTGDLILILNRQEWIDLQNDFNFTDLGKAAMGIDFFQGVKVLFNDDIDKNNALILHKDLLQFWVLPSETRHYQVGYIQEETIDYIYETRHSLDVVPIYSNMWIQFKAA